MKIRFLKIIFNLIQLLFLAIVLLTVLSLFSVPKDLQMYVVETGSMEPVIQTGALAFVTPSTLYQVGDVITFKSRVTKDSTKNYMVTHRINSIQKDNGDTYFITKGDANAEIDPLRANQLDVVGKVGYSIPYIGYIIGFAKTKPGFLALIITPALIIVYSEIYIIWREMRKPNKKKGTSFFINSNGTRLIAHH